MTNIRHQNKFTFFLVLILFDFTEINFFVYIIKTDFLEQTLIKINKYLTVENLVLLPLKNT